MSSAFFYGGSVTLGAGILAHYFGPAFGGLFLAVPAIFPASATLIAKHERERAATAKSQVDQTKQACEATSLDAEGAAFGSVGLVTFALLVWKFMNQHSAWVVLLLASLASFAASVLL